MTPTLRPFHPHDIPWLIDRHQALYAESDGFDESFGRLVESILIEFALSAEPGRDAGWIADDEGERLGSIFCTSTNNPAIAKLRLFLVEPAARGTGLGKRLLDTCIAFARDSGRSRLTLWTHDSHRAAIRLYQRHGFAMTAEEPVRHFGQDMVQQQWALALR